MSNFFISIGFLITAIQIFINKKIVRAYDGVDYSLMGDYFYLVPGIASLAGAILFFWIGYRSITFKNFKKSGVIAVAKPLKLVKIPLGVQIVASH